MYSRLYIFLSLVFILSIWFDWQWWAVSSYHTGDGIWAPNREIRLSALILSGLPPVMWLDTILKCGWRAIGCIPMMARIFPRSRRSWILLGLVFLMLTLWLDPLGERHQFEPIVIIALTITLLWLQPPSVLVLGQSNKSTGRVLKAIALATYPLRTVALLDHGRTGYSLGSFSVFTDDLRTTSDHMWETVVERLADAAVLIVLDARTESPVVKKEVGKLKNCPDRLCRTLFVVGANGEAPALQFHGLTNKSTGISAAFEEEMSQTEPVASVKHPWGIPFRERRRQPWQKLARTLPAVALCATLVWSGLSIFGGEGAQIFAWIFVIFCGYSTFIGVMGLLVQLLDIIAYFLVSDEQWHEMQEKDSLNADLRWKIIGLVPPTLYATIWAVPGLWIFTLLR